MKSHDDAALLARLLHGKSENEFTAHELATKAHARWSKKEFRAAAALFNAAASQASKEFASGASPLNQEMNSLVRMALTLCEEGDFHLAEPYLWQAINYDWISNGLSNDSHMVEWAYFELLKHTCMADRSSFESLFDSAVSRCRELNREFPSIHPKQEELLEIAYMLNSKSACLHIIRLIVARKPISRPTRQRICQIESRLNAHSDSFDAQAK